MKISIWIACSYTYISRIVISDSSCSCRPDRFSNTCSSCSSCICWPACSTFSSRCVISKTNSRTSDSSTFDICSTKCCCRYDVCSYRSSECSVSIGSIQSYLCRRIRISVLCQKNTLDILYSIGRRRLNIKSSCHEKHARHSKEK